MMGIIGQLVLATLGVIALITALAAVMMARQANHRFRWLEQNLLEKVSRLESELSAMMDGAFGVASQLRQVEMNLKDTAQRQEQLQQRDLGNLPYNEAVRLVSQGAGVDDLVEQCGLSRSEAELVELLHKKSSPLMEAGQGRPAPRGGQTDEKNG